MSDRPRFVGPNLDPPGDPGEEALEAFHEQIAVEIEENGLDPDQAKLAWEMGLQAMLQLRRSKQYLPPDLTAVDPHELENLKQVRKHACLLIDHFVTPIPDTKVPLRRLREACGE